MLQGFVACRERLTDLANTKLDNTLLSEFGSLAYDGAGNRKTLTSTVSGAAAYSGTTTYQYDSKDQLTQENSSRLGGYTNNIGFDNAARPTRQRDQAAALLR